MEKKKISQIISRDSSAKLNLFKLFFFLSEWQVLFLSTNEIATGIYGSMVESLNWNYQNKEFWQKYKLSACDPEIYDKTGAVSRSNTNDVTFKNQIRIKVVKMAFGGNSIMVKSRLPVYLKTAANT